MIGSTALREQRKVQYLITKAEYAKTIRKERYEPWKKFYTVTSAINPWNVIYRLAAGRRKQAALTPTLKKKDGTLTTNLHETLQYTLQNLTPKDNQTDDKEIHKQIRAITQEAIDRDDDKEIALQEVKTAVASMREEKAPGKDGIPSEVYKSLVETLP